MVNCVTCNKAFRSRIGKSSKTRCESCAVMWRQKQILQEENDRFREAKDIEVKIRELSLREKEIELERQKVTIKETSALTGNVIELTCFYDENSQTKVHDLLTGARGRLLPQPPTEPNLRVVPRRRYLSTPTFSDDESRENIILRRPRKLPSIESFQKKRTKQRYRLEEEGSNSANTSGLSVD